MAGVIKKIVLSDGSTHYLYDVTAARATDLENYLSLSGGTVTGDTTIDAMLIANNLRVVSIDDRDIAVTNVLTWDSEDGEVQRRNADNLLEDIGGISYSVNENDGILSFKIGKNNS